MKPKKYTPPDHPMCKMFPKTISKHNTADELNAEFEWLKHGLNVRGALANSLLNNLFEQLYEAEKLNDKQGRSIKEMARFFFDGGVSLGLYGHLPVTKSPMRGLEPRRGMRAPKW